MENQKLIFFDGICGLCNRWVTLMLRQDREARLRFAPLQGPTAAAALRLLPKPWPDALIGLEGDRLYLKSEAVLWAFSQLPAPWSWMRVLGLFPLRLRNFAYDFMAQRRYRFFGRFESCPLPEPSWKERFLP
jgi:predicted DCC family thiol-disulfide oxidoreductase YuxK